MEFNARITSVAIVCVLLLGSGVLFAQPTEPLCADLVTTGYGLIGDTLEGDLVLSGFVKGHSVSLEVMPMCVSPTRQYRFFRTPLGASVPDLQTDWMPMAYTNMDGGGDSEVFKYYAAVTDGDTVTYSNPDEDPAMDLWLMHDWYRPDRIEGISTYYYPSPTRIRINWYKGTDSASGVYKYYIYRAPSGLGYTLEYIDPTETPIDSVLDDGRAWYDWSDYEVTPDECYWYVIVPMDKAGWIRRDGNDIFRRCAAVSGFGFPPCAQLQPLDRYHVGGGVTIRVNLDACPGDPDEVVQYRFRKYGVFIDSVSGDPDMYIMDETDWTDTPFYFFSTMECSTYTFSAQARYLGGTTSPWSHLIPTYPLTTNDPTPPGCPDEMFAHSYGEDGIYVHFEQDPGDDCGSGILGYHLFRFPADSISDHLPPDSSDIADYVLWEYYVNEEGIYTFQDDGPTDPVIDLIDNVTYYYVVCPYDSAGWTNWLDCGDLQIDTATVDKGVAAPMANRLPAYACDGEIYVEFVDTTRCDATEVEIQWSAEPEFGGATFVGVGPIPLHGDTAIGGFFDFTNHDDGICTNWDTLQVNISGLYETQWFFRARFYDIHSNVSEWSNISITRVDNTPPTTTSIINVQSFSDSVNTVDILLNWDESDFNDADGIGIDSVKVYRSAMAGDLGTVIATVSKFDNKFVDYDPVPTNNWHDNVYRVVPYDYCGHMNTEGGQGCFAALGQHPPAVPRIDTVLVSHYLDSFTIVWSDTGISPLTTKYVLRHGGTESWLWIGDTIIAPNTHLGTVPSHRYTFPIEELFGGPRHYFMMYALDGESPANQSGWSEVFAFDLPEALTVTDTIHIRAGWNFISLPVMPANNEANVIFPGGLDYYEWNPTTSIYDPITVMQPGKAYWVLMSSTADYPITGIPVVRVEETEIGPGWWSIGTPYDSTVAMLGSGFTWDGTGWARAYGYDGETPYYTTTHLNGGEAYWLLLSGTGDFYSEAGMAKGIVDDPVIDWNINIDIDGSPIELAYSTHAESGIDAADIVMPPAPPSGAFSPCFVDESGYRYLREVRPDGVWNISAPYGSIISWNAKALPSVELEIVTDFGTFDMHKVESIEFLGTAKVVTKGVLPTEFTLGQNVPNPFNATSTVPFSVPVDSRVSIKIYDINGHTISTLVESYVEVGSHRVVWDGLDDLGRSVPCGIYLCRMEAGSFAETRRMLLVK
ncbi:hypothetical protein KAH81_00820 [bacterium]|nr:hypothetical protein [bacterium]